MQERFAKEPRRLDCASPEATCQMKTTVSLTHCCSAVMNTFLISFADYLLSMYAMEVRIASLGPLVKTLKEMEGVW